MTGMGGWLVPIYQPAAMEPAHQERDDVLYLPNHTTVTVPQWSPLTRSGMTLGGLTVV